MGRLLVRTRDVQNVIEWEERIMRRLTVEERIALKEVGEPGEGPVSDATFVECIRQGWGYWGSDELWYVTPRGRHALAIDLAADAAS
jgi:hypothetical protein